MSDAAHGENDLARRVAALSDEQRTLLARQVEALIDEPASRQAGSAAAVDGLLALVVARDGHTPTADALREHLAARLPPHMVPRRFVAVDALPRTRAGKLDRRALAVPHEAATGAADTRRAEPATGAAPHGEAEQVLARIWMDVLGLPDVGVDEDFYELGGDSLLSIRILSRASQEGLRISPEAFFANPTIAGQAKAAGAAGGVAAERGPVSGPLPLTPIQRWFFERIALHAHHWNQSFLFELRGPLGLSTLERVVQALLHHHDALRMQFDAAAGTAVVVPPDAEVPVERHDLRGCADEALADRVDAIARRLNASLDLGRAPLLRAALLQTRTGLPDRLLLLAHHLLVDGLSWRILLEDFETACRCDERGEPIRLPQRTSSYKRWSERLAEHAQSESVRAGLDHWLEVGARPGTLPRDVEADARDNVFATARTHRQALAPHLSAAVVRELPAAYRVGVDKLLLAALVVALYGWRGPGPFRLDLEGHGRESLFADLDVSRTVGWFTSVFPIALDVPATGDPLAALEAVRAPTALIPDGGIGHGLLRELCTDGETRSALRTPPAELLFNYLGQVGGLGGQDTRLRLELDGCGTPRAPHGPRAYLLEINAYVDDAVLRVDWGYSEAFHREATVAALAGDFERALDALLARARGGETAAVRPEDFPLAGLDQGDLDRLAEALGEIDADDTAGTPP